MNIRLHIASLTLATGLALISVVFAQAPAKPGMATTSKNPTLTLGMPVTVQNIAPSAMAAVKVVDAFSAAIKAGKLDTAEKLLDPSVLILESGGSERSRDQYLRGHAIADAAFLQNARQQLRYRQAQAEGDFAWVASEGELRSKENGKQSMLRTTETMLLKKTPQGWKIVHIHWSSRPAPGVAVDSKD